MKTFAPPRMYSFIFFILIAGVPGRAQNRARREKYFTYGFNTGIVGGSAIKDNCYEGSRFNRAMGFVATDNGRHQTMLDANTSLGLHTGFLWKDKNDHSYTALQADFERNRCSYVFNNPYSYTVTTTMSPKDNDADDNTKNTSFTYNRWAENDVYLKYSLSLQRFWFRANRSVLKGDSYFYLKESFGQTFLHRNQGHNIKPGDEEHIQCNDTVSVTATTTAYDPTSFMLSSELGIRAFSPDKDRALDFGIVWHMPFSATYTREYDFYNRNTLVAADPVSFTGSSVLLNITYTLNEKLKNRQPDSTKIEREKIDVLAKTHVENDRVFEVQQKIVLNSDLVSVKVWDRGTVDGDIITLYLNGEDILDNYTTSKTKKEVALHLRPGENFLVMHAVNLGRIPPNTAAIEIEDGMKHKTITINSDMKKSGAVEITYKPVL
ncbi:MAG TPA: hypothetical protein VNY73_03370 [Bacteroidia bacterium]|jgi:hypothetical protein|nr:hypothetical protein [Bacteroidia bacterium]